ncbi:Cdc45-like protein [Skeletonema marinoi]|uniref:Cdc45-like protein n=1 Tax=Skeletonema marinoi TaxID=267567 RepID=A0AAD9DBC7_9STRA|nr:Cdc45-like protein [Skeletonema marinoi]
MILERDQWHLGYASLLRDCRGPSSTHDTSSPHIGRALLLVHPDSTDALATSRILSYMLRADGVPYQIRPCLGFERLKLILGSVGCLPKNDDANNDDNNNDNGDNLVEDEYNNNSTTTSDIKAVVLINMGANRNLSKLFLDHHHHTTNHTPAVRAYVFDNHRPYHLSNIHSGKNVVLFNDRPFEEEEIVSDGDNLSGDESSTSSEESDDDDDSSEEGGREEESEGEEEFDLRGMVWEKRAKRQKTRSSDDSDDDGDNAGGDTFKKGGEDDYNPLDTTAATADITLATTQGEDDLDIGQGTATQEQQAETFTAAQEPPVVISLRELHRQRRNRIRLHYSSGSYHASPSSWTAYTLCTQLRFGDTPDLLWLACVGVTDAYLHGRLDVSGYSALTVDLKRHVGRLFPNELVDRAGRAVYAEDLERGFDASEGDAGGAMTQISLSENGPSVWKQTGRQRLMELLAKMGFPLDQCRQPWAFVGTSMRRRLRERLEECTEEYGLGNVSYTGFVRVTGYKSLLSASDMSYAVTALLEWRRASSEDDDMLDHEAREDREIVQAFNVAFDALNPNGSSSSTTGATLLSSDGGIEGGDLSHLVNGGNMTGTTGLGAGIRLAMALQKTIMSTARNLVDRNAITRLNHFRYAYLHCSSNGGGGSNNGPGARQERILSRDQYHVFAKPLVLTKLAHFLMDVHRENGKWTGTKSRPLVLLAEKPRSNTYMVIGYEYPEESGNVVRNKFGQNFELAAKTMRGTFWFDSFDSSVVEVGAKDVQRFIEQLHYMMESV